MPAIGGVSWECVLISWGGQGENPHGNEVIFILILHNMGK